MRLSKEDEQTNRLVYKGMDTSYVAADLQEYVMYTFTVVSFNIKYNWTSKPVVAMETTHPAGDLICKEKDFVSQSVSQ